MNPFGLPRDPDWSVYRRVLIDGKFYVNLANSLYYSAFATVLSSIVCILAGFAIVRMRWRASGLYLAILMLGIMIPIDSMILPLYVIIRKAGLNTPKITLVLIYGAFSLPRTIFIITGFLKDIPKSIEEAAIIDGCTIWQVLRQIIIPIIQPAIATAAIFNFLNVWNDLLISLIFISDVKEMTIQTGLMKFQGTYETQYAVMLAGVTIVVLPIMLVYVLLQKRIIEGMTAGATKG